MTSKINIYDIVACHLTTLQNAKTGKPSKSDYFAFFAAPCLFSALSWWADLKFSDDALNALVTVGSLVAGLMLNLLVLIFDRRIKASENIKANPGQPALEVRARVLKELYYNICYATVVALLLAALPVVVMQLADDWVIAISTMTVDLKMRSHFGDPLLVAVATHLGLTMLMIVKRTFRLLSD